MATKKPAVRTNRAPKKRRDWKPGFLAAFEKSGTVTAACEAAEVGRRTVYDEYQRNPEFAEAWDAVENSATDNLEKVAMRRAIDGSDTLAIFLLKSRRPEMYRERFDLNHAGKVEQKVEVTLPTTDEWQQQVAKVLQNSGALNDPDQDE